ncbi:MAG TPA: glycerophosphodiester phosphodiesterase family protein [Methylomirabilota bacterium]|nr:glycerophosphodiester phosphodiesterase family protein [Methylomirabilota bacterium]
MIITSHRGAGFLEPENTLRAMRRAIELGVDQIEIDVRPTRDGRLVLMHDPTVDRTTNGTGKVADLSLAEIRLLDAGQGEQVPTLEEVLAFTTGKVILQIELKEAGAMAAVVQAIRAAGQDDNVILTSFIHSQLTEARRLHPHLPLGALWGRLPVDIVQQTKQLGVQALHLWHEFIDEQLVTNAHAAGLLIRAWNANTEEDMQRLIALGVDAIGSDRPDLLLDVCRRAGVR